MLQPSPRAHAMQVRHSHSGFAAESHDGASRACVSVLTALTRADTHAVMINMDSAYDLPGGRPRPRQRHGLRGLLQLLRRRCGGMTLALAALAAILLLLRASRGSCAASAASVRPERPPARSHVAPRPRPAAAAHAAAAPPERAGTRVGAGAGGWVGAGVWRGHAARFGDCRRPCGVHGEQLRGSGRAGQLVRPLLLRACLLRGSARRAYVRLCLPGAFIRLGLAA